MQTDIRKLEKNIDTQLIGFELSKGFYINSKSRSMMNISR